MDEDKKRDIAVINVNDLEYFMQYQEFLNDCKVHIFLNVNLSYEKKRLNK